MLKAYLQPKLKKLAIKKNELHTVSALSDAQSERHMSYIDVLADEAKGRRRKTTRRGYSGSARK